MKIVLVGGCFDFIHYGHVSFLTQARSYGDMLIVALESDENIKRLKGKDRPIHTQEQRKKMLESLSIVDKVINLPIMKNDADYANLVKKINPSVIAATKGDKYLEKKRLQAQSVHAELVEIPKIKTPSTSTLAKLINIE